MAKKLQQFLGGYQKSWLLLVQSTIWIAAVIASFVLPPPVGTSAETQVWVRFGQFVITILIGLLFLVALRYNRKKDVLPWAATSAGFLILGTFAFFTYQILAARWTTDYAGTPVVIGDTLTASAAEYQKANPTLTNHDLVMHFAGKVEKVWTPASIQQHRFLLAGIYVLAMPLFATCIITLLQAIQCATADRTRKRPRPASPTVTAT